MCIGKIDISNGSSVIDGYSMFHFIGSSSDSIEWLDTVTKYVPSSWDIRKIFNKEFIVSPNAKIIKTVKSLNGKGSTPSIYVHLYTNFLEAARYHVLNLFLEMKSNPNLAIGEFSLIKQLSEDFEKERIDTIIELISKINIENMEFENLNDMSYAYSNGLVSLLVSNIETLLSTVSECGSIYVFTDTNFEDINMYTTKYMVQYIAVILTDVDVYPLTCSNALGLARTMLCYSNTLSDADVKRVLDAMDKKGFVSELRRCGCVIPLTIENLPDKLPLGVYEKFLETYIYRCLFVYSTDNINISNKHLMLLEKVIK